MTAGQEQPVASGREHGALSAKVLAQLLLMQNILCNLPDERSIIAFVCRGLHDIPGLDEACTEIPPEAAAEQWLRFPIPTEHTAHTELRLLVSAPDEFRPYEPFLRNFLSMVALILDSRHQRDLIERYNSELGQRVEQRTQELRAEIQERTQVEQALQQSRNMLAHTLDSIPQAVFWKDRSGVYLGCNAVFAKTAGLADPADIVGKTDFDLPWPRGEAEAYRADDQTVISDQIPKRHFVEPLQRADGTRIWIDTTKVPLCDSSGQGYGVLGVFEDITDRRRAEDENARMQEQLPQAQKMESVGRLAGGVAHDFNNMLQAIIGYAGLALDQTQGNPELAEHLAEVIRAARRSSDLTHQLLAFARKQTIQPRVLDLNETVASALKMLQRLIGENIEIVWEPAPDLGPVLIDPVQVDQILANLTVNARDAIGGVGQITIATGNRTVPARADEALAPGEYAVLTVRDTGSGMDAATRSHLFEPFFTTKALGHGTGLGLATVYGIVKQNRGHIAVESEPGHGTVFTISLPRHSAVAATQKTDAETDVQGGTETILLVEDEEMILRLATRVLERLGYQVIAARRPNQALTLAAQTARIDLLITDVVMPEHNGRELHALIVPLHPGLRCLFISGYTADVIAPHNVLADGVHFLSKPFPPTSLARKVRQVLDEKAPVG